MVRKPTLSGEILLDEFLEPMQISQTALAKHIEVDYKVINRIVSGHIIPLLRFIFLRRIQSIDTEQSLSKTRRRDFNI